MSQVPFSLSKLIGAGTGVAVPTEQLFKSLVMTLLVPLIVGKVRKMMFYNFKIEIELVLS